jgi:hypothetical protein
MSKDDEPVVVYAGGPIDAALVKSLLDVEGVPAFLQDQNMGTLELPWAPTAGPYGGVKIVVPARMFRRADRIVQKFIRERV